MDHVLQKTTGTEVVDDGGEICVSVETTSGQKVVVHLAPETINHLVAELMNAKSKAAFEVIDAERIYPIKGRQPILASRITLTDLVDQGHSVVTIETPDDGVFEFHVPLLGKSKHTGKR